MLKSFLPGVTFLRKESEISYCVLTVPLIDSKTCFDVYGASEVDCSFRVENIILLQGFSVK